MTARPDSGRITQDRNGQKAPAMPTAIGLDVTLTAATRRHVPVCRWDGTQHRIYLDGVEVEGWTPWSPT